jgi:hypothetical protein
MKGRDAVASGVFESEGEQGVEETGNRTDEHATRKATRRTEVLEVALSDRGRVLSEQSPQSHSDQSSERGVRFGCVLHAHYKQPRNFVAPKRSFRKFWFDYDPRQGAVTHFSEPAANTVAAPVQRLRRTN